MTTLADVYLTMRVQAAIARLKAACEANGNMRPYWEVLPPGHPDLPEGWPHD